MTSTNFNVGMAETRSSSRVLKPPGGGHSDIFGIYEADSKEPPTPKVKYTHARSTISEVFAANEPKNPINMNVQEDKEDQKYEEEEKKTENEKDIEDRISNNLNNENEAPPKLAPTPQRIRVPPGGFSSGLW